ncbi:MAG: SDR family NAD(P)-dependent oxidoreductase [Pseudomonadota bacterium]
MKKRILITGSTDGIGLATAEMLLGQGHHVLLHGRDKAKLKQTEKKFSTLKVGGSIQSYSADLSNMCEVKDLAKALVENNIKLDVLVNNAGVFKTPEPITKDGLDVRFAVNTIAPYLLTKQLLPILNKNGRVINLSSAAQSTVDPKALVGQKYLNDMEAYSQSKLAITTWSRSMALSLKDNGPIIIAVNPGSLLASKMVQEGFGVEGSDISIGAEILMRAALSDEFAEASSQYFDNDAGQFASPHPDALNSKKSDTIVKTIEAILNELGVN